VACLFTRLGLQPVLRYRAPKRSALGTDSVGTVLGGIFSPFPTHAPWDIHLHLMDWTLTVSEAENRICSLCL